MRGVIVDRHIKGNLGLIRREFGSGCLLRCLRAMATGEQVTFLEIVFPCRIRAPHGKGRP